MEVIQKHVNIEGKVQGVGFRAFIMRNAQKLNIKGWVKNTYDGRVEAVFAGKKEQIKKMINKIHQGPGWARVENVNTKNEPYDDSLKEFHIKY